MLKKDRWRLVLVAVVVVAALLSVFPIGGRIRLGLDLKGGAHILLQAQGTSENPLTDDVVLVEAVARALFVTELLGSEGVRQELKP